MFVNCNRPKVSRIVVFSVSINMMYNELIPQAIMNAIGKCCCNYSYQELIENPKGSEAHFIFVVRATW